MAKTPVAAIAAMTKMTRMYQRAFMSRNPFSHQGRLIYFKNARPTLWMNFGWATLLTITASSVAA